MPARQVSTGRQWAQVSGGTGVHRRPRTLTSPGHYATSAGRRLQARRLRHSNPLARLAVTVWESGWFTRQVLVALLVFGLVYGLMRTPVPALAGLRGRISYYLTTDLDVRGAARQVFSSNLKEKVAEGWRVFPELWNRLTGRDKAPAGEETSFVFPVNGTITSTFGYRPDPVTGEVAFHTGIDIAATEGTPIVAALGGTVLRVEDNDTYGKVVEIDHGQGVVTLYAHAKEISVKAGDVVEQGDTIATVGMTGKATTPHCHFEVIIAGQPADPLQMKGLAAGN